MSGAENPIDVAASLLARIANSSETDFSKLFETYALRVRARLAMRGLTGRASDLDDATQEVFLRIWRQRETYRPTGSGVAYLMGVANLVAAEWRRRERRRVAREKTAQNGSESARGTSVREDCTAAEHSAIERETVERVRAAVAGLPEKERHAVQLCWIDGTPSRLAAVLLECSLNALKKRLRKSRRRLRGVLTSRTPLRLACLSQTPKKDI